MPEDVNPELPIIVVDLDGTLVASDMLHESFWTAMAQHPLSTLRQLWGTGGRAGLKRRLASIAEIDVSRLPYNPQVIAYVTQWRDRGARIVLATATDLTLAQRISEHLELFDEVHASDGAVNLKGPQKAKRLCDAYGMGNFIYVGDSSADLPVWQEAGQIVTVNAPRGLRAQADALGPATEHLGLAGVNWRGWLRALRPHQWLKNVLIFVPMLAGHAMSIGNIVESLAAFVAFSLAASSVYLVNDLLDLGADRAHPRKKNRPLAAGTIPIGPAGIAAPALLISGLLIALWLGMPFFGVIIAYYLLTTAYSLHLKRRTVADIWVLAMLYSMRILAGAAATGITPSVWLMAFSIFFFFALAAVKRQAELVDTISRDGAAMRRRGYHREDVLLIAMMAIASGYISVLVMALYVRTPHIEELYSFPQALLGICLMLLYWISRIVMVTHRGQMHDDPMVFALSDRVSLLCLLAMLGFAVAGFVL